MPGPAPKDPKERRRRNVPARGEWKTVEGRGWQHGPVPDPPEGLMDASLEAWKAWFGSIVAATWEEEHLPGLWQLVRLYDQVERGKFERSAEMRQEMAEFGLTPKSQAGLRVKKPEAPTAPKKAASGDSYGHLRSV